VFLICVCFHHTLSQGLEGLPEGLPEVEEDNVPVGPDLQQDDLDSEAAKVCLSCHLTRELESS
jgi:hypothetical protein